MIGRRQQLDQQPVILGRRDELRPRPEGPLLELVGVELVGEIDIDLPLVRYAVPLILAHEGVPRSGDECGRAHPGLTRFFGSAHERGVGDHSLTAAAMASCFHANAGSPDRRPLGLNQPAGTVAPVRENDLRRPSPRGRTLAAADQGQADQDAGDQDPGGPASQAALAGAGLRTWRSSDSCTRSGNPTPTASACSHCRRERRWRKRRREYRPPEPHQGLKVSGSCAFPPTRTDLEERDCSRERVQGGEALGKWGDGRASAQTAGPAGQRVRSVKRCRGGAVGE